MEHKTKGLRTEEMSTARKIQLFTERKLSCTQYRLDRSTRQADRFMFFFYFFRIGCGKIAFGLLNCSIYSSLKEPEVIYCSILRVDMNIRWIWNIDRIFSRRGYDFLSISSKITDGNHHITGIYRNG